jgi:hypothetical protein
METNFNNNIEKWSGFYKTEKEAEESLQKQVSIMSLKKLSVSAKKELIFQKKNPMLLYKFTVVTSVKNCD